MKVKMKVNQLGAPYGKVVESYKAGLTYDIPEPLCCIFITEKWATKVEEAVVQPPVIEEKMILGPTENKAIVPPEVEEKIAPIMNKDVPKPITRRKRS